MSEPAYPTQLVGWVVWGKVKSLPWWPGQVMHPSKGPPEVRKMAAMKTNAGKLLVMFLGDNKYAFCTRESVVDFAENKERHTATNYASRFWRLGVEEAEELLARRTGLQPSTEHEPVDFAEKKKTNYISLAKAWVVAGSPRRQQSSPGAGGSPGTTTRAPERSKSTPPQAELPKPAPAAAVVIAPAAVAPSARSPPKDSKGAAPAVTPAPVPKDPPKSHRASGTVTDDGRPKSIGGVMLEWARYMPLVAATRKGAELSSADTTIMFARRMARGEQMVDTVSPAPVEEHALQVLHSFALQRRLHGVDSALRTGADAAAAAAAKAALEKAAAENAAAAAATAGQPAKPTLRVTRGALAAAKDTAVKPAALPSQGPGDGQVVVLEVLTVANPTAVPVPAAVVEALRRTAKASSRAVSGSPAATPPAAGGPSGSGGTRGGKDAKQGGAHPASAGGDGSEGGAKQEGQKHADALGAAWEADPGEVDVVLKVNGKLLPYLSLSTICWVPSSGACEGATAAPQLLAGAGTQAAVQPSAPIASRSRSREQSPAATTAAAAAAPAGGSPAAGGAQPAAAGGPVQPLASAGSPTSEQPAGEHAGGHAQSKPAAGGDAAGTAAGPAVVAVPGRGAGDEQEAEPKPASAQAAPASGDATPAGAASPSSPPSPSPSSPPAAGPPDELQAGSADAGAASGSAPAAPTPSPGSPTDTAAPRCASPAAVAPSARAVASAVAAAITGSAPASAPAAAPPPPAAATLDLSRGLAPWLRSEMRITSWTLVGPRLLLVTVSADRKRDGGLGGIKREARLLLAEARERGTSPAAGDEADGGEGGEGGEPKLKRRLRSAVSPPAPPVPVAAAGVAGGTSGPSGPGPGAGAAAVAAECSSGGGGGGSGGGAKGEEVLPTINTSGPAAAALMRSRLLQQKRLASQAEASAAGGSGSGAAGGGDASRTGSSAVGPGGSGGGDTRVPKKIKLVRFPVAPGSAINGSGSAVAGSGNLTSRTSSGGGAAGAGAGGGSGSAAAGGSAPGTGGGGGNANVSTFYTGYEAEWDMSYPPWLPKPTVKGAFITVSHTSHSTHNHNHGRRGKVEGTGGSGRDHHHHRDPAARGSTAGSAPPPSASQQQQQPAQQGIRQFSNQHASGHHHHHHHHHGQAHSQHAQSNGHHHHQHYHHSSSHQHTSHAFAAPPQSTASLGTARYSSGGARSGSLPRRSSGFDGAWQQQQQRLEDDMNHLTSERLLAWPSSSDAGVISPYDYDFMPPPAAGTWPSVGPPGPAAAVGANNSGGGAAPDGYCEHILLDIRVGDEGDAEAAPCEPRVGGGEAAITATVHLPPPDGRGRSGSTAGPSVNPPAPNNIYITPVHTQHHSHAHYHQQQQHHHYHQPATISPFASQPAVATPFSPTAAAAAAAAGSPYGGMAPADVDLAVTAALLADRNLSVCESASMNVAATTGPATGEVSLAAPMTAAQAASAAGGLAGGDGDSMVVDSDGVAGAAGGGADAAVPPSRLAQYEGEVTLLRQECQSLREQLKLRVTPGLMDPLPQQQLPYGELVAQVSERVLALALALPSLSGAAKQSFIAFSRTLMQAHAGMSAACAIGGAQHGHSAQAAPPAAASALAEQQLATGAAAAAPVAADGHAAVGACGGRSLAVARVAAELVRSAAAPGLPLHPEDRWAFINLAAELLRP